MSKYAVAKQPSEKVGAISMGNPSWSWQQTINSPLPALTVLNNALFRIIDPQTPPAPESGEISIRGVAEIEPQPAAPASPPIPFTGSYDSKRLISFTMNLEDGAHLFYGVFLPGGTMTGLITLAGARNPRDADPDEGSWSAQARPADDDPPRKPAAGKRRE